MDFYTNKYIIIVVVFPSFISIVQFLVIINVCDLYYSEWKKKELQRSHDDNDDFTKIKQK